MILLLHAKYWAWLSEPATLFGAAFFFLFCASSPASYRFALAAGVLMLLLIGQLALVRLDVSDTVIPERPEGYPNAFAQTALFQSAMSFTMLGAAAFGFLLRRFADYTRTTERSF
ncbi:hypothetical protein [Sulfitobacter sp.]|uniref:hypothetical protein n=1 Tax=Sulfitobacter sp. TaxID=1903071 RepID=UPI003EF6682D